MRKVVAFAVMLALLGASLMVPLPKAEGSSAIGLLVGHGMAIFPWVGVTVGDQTTEGPYNNFEDTFMSGFPPKNFVMEYKWWPVRPKYKREKGEEVNERIGDYVLLRKWKWGPIKWDGVPPITYQIAIARDSAGKYWLGVVVDWDIKGRVHDMFRGFFCFGDDECAKHYDWMVEKAVGDIASRYQGKFAPLAPLPDPNSPPEEAWKAGGDVVVKQGGNYYVAGLDTTDQLWLPALVNWDYITWVINGGVTWGNYWKKLRALASDLTTARCIVNEDVPVVVTATYLGCEGNGWYRLGSNLDTAKIPSLVSPPREFTGRYSHSGLPWPAYLMPYYPYDALTTDLFTWDESATSYREFWAMLPLLFNEDHIGMWPVKPGEFIGHNPGKNGYKKEAMMWPPTAFLHHHPECVPDYDTSVFDRYISDWAWSAWHPRDAGDPFLSTQRQCAIEFTKELWETLSSGIKDIWRTGPWKQGDRNSAYIPDATGARAPVTATWPVIMSTFSADYPVASGFRRVIYDPQMASANTIWMQEDYLKANYWQSGIDAVPFIDVKAGRSYLPLRVFALTYVPLYDPVRGSWEDGTSGYTLSASLFSLPGDLWRVVKDKGGKTIDRQIILKGMLIPLAGDPLYPQVTARAWIKISLGTKTIKEVRKLHYIPPDNLFTAPVEKDWTVYVVPGKDVDIEVYVTVAFHIPYVEKRVIRKNGKVQIMYQPVDVLACRLHDLWAQCNKLNWKGGWNIPPVGLVVFHGHMHSPYDFIFWRNRIYVPSRLAEWLLPATKVEWDGFYRIFRFKTYALNSIESIVNAYKERSYRVDYAETDLFKAAKADGPFSPTLSPVYYLNKDAWPSPDRVEWSPNNFLTKPRPVIRLPDYFKPGFENRIGERNYRTTGD